MASSAPSQLSVEIDDLSRRFGRRWALAHVTVSVAPGGGLMLLGANGSGKTTLLRCLATELKPHHGAIRVGGVDLWEERHTLRTQIAFVSHNSRLYDDLSGLENLRFWHGLAASAADPVQMMTRVGLDPSRDDPVRTYSAGMKRRLALAVALLKRPGLVLLDEPFASLDADGRAVVLDVIRDLRHKGTTFVVATHLPDIAQPFCDQTLTLDAGRIVDPMGAM